jgi:hypothetical protein
MARSKRLKLKKDPNTFGSTKPPLTVHQLRAMLSDARDVNENIELDFPHTRHEELVRIALDIDSETLKATVLKHTTTNKDTVSRVRSLSGMRDTLKSAYNSTPAGDSVPVEDEDGDDDSDITLTDADDDNEATLDLDGWVLSIVGRNMLSRSEGIFLQCLDKLDVTKYRLVFAGHDTRALVLDQTATITTQLEDNIHALLTFWQSGRHGCQSPKTQ